MENINTLEKQIKETQELLEKINNDTSKIEQLKTHRILFGLLAIVFLASTLWLVLRKTAPIEKEIDPDYTLVRIDSLKKYKHYYFSKNLENDTNLKNEKIIYLVQIGAFEFFKLNANKINGFKQFNEDGLNKITVGTFTKYINAKQLQDELIDLGFEDCFLSSRSYGKLIDIREALSLSNEPEYLDQ